MFNVRTRENEARSLLQESDISNSVSNWTELFQSMQEQGTALVKKNYNCRRTKKHKKKGPLVALDLLIVQRIAVVWQGD